MNGVLVHFLKSDESRTGLLEWMDHANGLRVSTCQRELWIGPESDVPSATPAHAVFRGEAAYELLLRIATGLESAVVGETEILGQFKAAWNSQEARLPREIRGIVQGLFEDVKMIRTHYLIGLGGQSYGSLVRKLLGGKLGANQKIGVIGAGALAKEILPYLSPAKILLTNRSPERLNESLLGCAPALRTQIEVRAYEDEASIWVEADVVLMCVPEDLERDALRMRWKSAGRARVLHLGLIRSTAESPWSGVECLERVFEMDQSQRIARGIQVEHARSACLDRARLRSLGGGVSVPHGWEDLAMFG